MARFDTLRVSGPLTNGGHNPMFAAVAADTRAAGTSGRSQTAYKFCAIALHKDKVSAEVYYEQLEQILPWLGDAREFWSALLRPLRHVGEVDFLDRACPGLIYDCPTEAVPSGPLVVITTAGFIKQGDWMERAVEFGTGVTAVRTSMTGMPGLHSQQSFLQDDADGFTVTLWRDFAAVRDFAYGPGVHKDHLLRQKAGEFADRTSFTRCVVERSQGLWHGSEPFGQSL